MQIKNKLFAVLAAVAGLGVISSCTKFAKVSLANEGTIYMPQAVDLRSTLHLYLIDSAQDVVFGADYGGLNYSNTNIPVEFKLDTNAIAAYNTANGTSYVAFPADAYTVTGYSSVIRAGMTSSDPLWFSVYTKKLVKGVKYMMPVTLINGTSGKFDSSLTTTYFKIDSIYIRKKDITGTGTLSVSNENDNGADAGESSKHLVDNDISTKYLCSATDDFWYQLQFPTAQVINEYTMTSGNDAPGRDPKDWELLGSNDGSTWDTLDTQTGQSFSGRQQTVIYQIPNLAAYTYYRIHVTHNNGDGLFQQSEWRLVQYY